MKSSKYIVGIDLGTTNCAVAYCETKNADETTVINEFMIAQLVNENEVKTKPILPSFVYLPQKKELPSGSLKLPWNKKLGYAVGLFAKKLGEKIPGRLVSSAKSWLCHTGIDKKTKILPWGSSKDVEKISPIEAVSLYLEHIKESWNFNFAIKDKQSRLENQEIFITVPASFDAVARDFTIIAAKKAGLKDVILLEEPQSAFYSWLKNSEDDWRNQVKQGDIIFVCDIGGGTTDFSLISVGENAGKLELERIAVGEHILLGGDNMDLALAQFAKSKFAQAGTKLDMKQTINLWHTCRNVKEKLLSDDSIQELPVTVLGSTSGIVGGTTQILITRDEIEKIIIDGFFAECGVEEKPVVHSRTGLQEIGLNYAADVNVLKHIAKFLCENNREGNETAKFLHPTAILFNGGIFKTKKIQKKVEEILNGWLAAEGADSIKVLSNYNLDLAVSVGAANYGLVKKGKGIRIHGGLARSYYIGIESSMPAIPGFELPVKCLCVAPFGVEEGCEVDVPEREFALTVGENVDFRFFSSTSRKDDIPGEMVEDWELSGIQELSPIQVKLESTDENKQKIPVILQCRATEIGTLELWFVSRDKKQKWRLEFSVRER